MIVSKKYGLLFIEIMRCASTSMHELLSSLDPDAKSIDFKPPYRKHGPLTQIARQINLDDYFKFCIMRNPWDWMVSKYCFHKKSGKHGVKGRTFQQWLKTEEALHSCYQIPIRNFYDYITHRGLFQVDQIYNFHRLDFLEEELSKITGRLISLPKLNSSKHTRYTDYYQSKENIERVRERYRWAVNTFDWAFGRDPGNVISIKIRSDEKCQNRMMAILPWS